MRNHSLRRYALVGITSIWIVVASCSSSESDTDNQGAVIMNEEVKAAVVADISSFGWIESDVYIETLNTVVMPPCEFVQVIHKMPSQGTRFYAVFPDRTLVVHYDELATQTILDKCPLPADANTWAELLVVFGGLGPPAVVDYTVKATLDESKSILRFRIKELDMNRIYDVTVMLNVNQILSVEKTLVE